MLKSLSALILGTALLSSSPPAWCSERVYYFHNDHLGTPQALTDAAGRVVWKAEYDPFGNASANEDPDGDGRPVVNNLRFPGQYYDAETGLHYNYHRYYDPSTGRYLQPDPIGMEGGPNPYSYARGNPIAFSDRLGLLPNPAEAACLGGPNPVCIGGVIADVCTWLTAAATTGILIGMSEDAAERQREYREMKDLCDTPPPPGGNDCSTLSRQIDHARRVIELYEKWDAKWAPGTHAQKIQDWKNRIQKLKDEYQRKCAPKCQ